MTKYILSASVLLSLTLSTQAWNVQPRFPTTPRRTSTHNNMGLASQATAEQEPAATCTALTPDQISKLRFRELQAELKGRALTTEGTTGQLRDRLREAVGLETECVVDTQGDFACDPSVEVRLERMFCGDWS